MKELLRLASLGKKLCVASSFALLSAGAFAAEPAAPGAVLLVVGTWGTQAEFKDIKVTSLDGKVLFQSADMKDMKGWSTEGGEWKVKDGVIGQSNGDTPAMAVLDKKVTDCVLTLKARKTGGDEGFLIAIQAENAQAHQWWNIAGWGNTQSGLEIPGLPDDKKDLVVDDTNGTTSRWKSRAQVFAVLLMAKSFTMWRT